MFGAALATDVSIVVYRKPTRLSCRCTSNTLPPVSTTVLRGHRTLLLACHHDNYHKGTDLVGIDPRTGKRAPLFNPRRHKWQHHFRWEGANLIGKTAIGRATVDVLAMNHEDMIDLRVMLQEEGVFPW